MGTKRGFLVSVVVGATSMLAGQAAAQNAVVAPPINNWSYQRHASTATQGYLQGQAAVVQSVGQANYLNSIAAANFQEAVRRNIENHGLYVRTVIESKELNRQFREKYAAPPMTKERWERIMASALPERLTAEQYDSATGRLVWPHILRGEEYRAFREPIDDLLASRTPETSGDGSPSQQKLDSLINGMMALLKSNIDTVSASQYGAAKWFLMTVAYEARQPLSDGAPPLPAAVPPVAQEPGTPDPIAAELPPVPPPVSSETTVN